MFFFDCTVRRHGSSSSTSPHNPTIAVRVDFKALGICQSQRMSLIHCRARNQSVAGFINPFIPPTPPPRATSIDIERTTLLLAVDPLPVVSALNPSNKPRPHLLLIYSAIYC